MNAIKWSTDYFIKCHVSEHEFYGQVGDFDIDLKYWGRPEDMNMSRPAHKIDEEHPGTIHKDLIKKENKIFDRLKVLIWLEKS